MRHLSFFTTDESGISSSKYSGLFFHMALLFFLLSLCSCSVAIKPDNILKNSLYIDLSDNGKYPARVSLFISLAENDATGVIGQFSAIDILQDDGVWFSLLNSPIVLNSGQLINNQLLLARKSLPLGKYTRMRITVSSQTTAKESISEIPLGSHLSVKKGDSRSLFLKWNIAEYLKESAHKESAFTAFPQLNQLTSDLVYVSCPEIDTVYMIRADTNRISGSIAVAGYPTYIVGSEDKRDIYVLTTTPPAIKIYNKISGSIRQSINLQAIQAPGYLAIDRKNSVIYVTDALSNYIFRIDLISGSVTAKRHLRETISYITYHDNNLIISVSSSQELLLLDPVSLRDIKAIPFGTDVTGLLVDNKKIYVAETNNNSIASYDLTSGKKEKIYVGFGPQRLVKVNQYIYAANVKSGSLSMFTPQNFNVLREIPIGGSPLEMTYSPAYHWLYVADRSTKEVSIIDTSTQKIVKKIYLGSSPWSLFSAD